MAYSKKFIFLELVGITVQYTRFNVLVTQSFLFWYSPKWKILTFFNHLIPVSLKLNVIYGN